MSYTLTNEEKITIINQHLRTLAFSKYNYEISILEESSGSAPSSDDTMQTLVDQVGILNAKISALMAEVESLQNPS